MYKLMVIDDEDWIRQRIVNTMDWASIGITTVLEAENGAQALEIAGEHLPDIILSDIRMPGLSGLDLVETLQRKMLSARVIFLSGYDDFQFAQRAIKLGAFDYLLKPVDDETLQSAVQSCIESIREQRRIENILEDFEIRLENHKPVLREHFFSDLLGGYMDEQTLEADLNYLGISTAQAGYICLSIQPGEEVRAAQDVHRIQFGIKNIVKELTDPLGNNQVIFLQLGEIACILFSNMEGPELKSRAIEAADKIRDMVRRLFQREVTVGVGEPCDEILGLSRSFEQSQQALSYKAYLGGGRVYTLESLEQTVLYPISHSYSLDQLKSAIQQGDRGKISEQIARLMEKLPEGEIRPIDLKSIYANVITSTVQTGYEFSAINQELPTFSYDFFHRLDDIDSVERFEKHLRHMVETLLDSLEKSRQGNKRKIVQKAIDYIQEHYREPLSLSGVADIVYLNPSYFCKIFKNETGTTFTKHIVNYRIDKAIALMEDPTLKIYEIADMVGYADVQYFTKLFKAAKGISPAQYREKKNSTKKDNTDSGI